MIGSEHAFADVGPRHCAAPYAVDLVWYVLREFGFGLRDFSVINAVMRPGPRDFCCCIARHQNDSEKLAELIVHKGLARLHEK